MWTYLIPAPVRLLIVAAIACIGFAFGFCTGEQRAGQVHIDYVAKQAAASVRVAQAQMKVVTQTQVKYVDRFHTIYQKGMEIERQVPVYVNAADNDRCTVNAGFVRSHNAAWEGVDPGTPADSDRKPASFSLADVAEANAANATACRAWREQALGWREFYNELQRAMK